MFHPSSGLLRKKDTCEHFDTLSADNHLFVEEGKADLANAKELNNAILEASFNIPLDQVGIFLLLHNCIFCHWFTFPYFLLLLLLVDKQCTMTSGPVLIFWTNITHRWLLLVFFYWHTGLWGWITYFAWDWSPAVQPFATGWPATGLKAGLHWRRLQWWRQSCSK